jgi:hypothetical protein
MRARESHRQDQRNEQKRKSLLYHYCAYLSEEKPGAEQALNAFDRISVNHKPCNQHRGFYWTPFRITTIPPSRHFFSTFEGYVRFC